jgi:peroxiredoxin
MNMKLISYTRFLALLLVPMVQLPAQETDEKPPARGERESARGMDPAERLKRMLEYFDADKDGVLTKEEYKGDKDRFRRMDANGDGKVDPKELEAIKERMKQFGGRRPSNRGGRGGGGRDRGEDNSPAVGKSAPDFTLKLLGKDDQVTLSEQCKDKPVVLTFGSYTCPPFRRSLEGMEEVYQAHKKDCNFLFVYVKEAHASDGWVSRGNLSQGIEIKQHKTYEERSGAAKTCQGKLEISMPILIDSLDDATAKQYGGVPNRAYLIAKGGLVIYKGERGPMGTRPDQVKAAIEELLEK